MYERFLISYFIKFYTFIYNQFVYTANFKRIIKTSFNLHFYVKELNTFFRTLEMENDITPYNFISFSFYISQGISVVVWSKTLTAQIFSCVLQFPTPSQHHCAFHDLGFSCVIWFYQPSQHHSVFHGSMLSLCVPVSSTILAPTTLIIERNLTEMKNNFSISFLNSAVNLKLQFSTKYASKTFTGYDK